MSKNIAKIKPKDEYLFDKKLILKEYYSILYLKNKYIFSAKRKSDGQIFTIGDEIFCKYTNKSFGKLTKLYQIENQLRCWVGEHLSLVVTGDYESGIVTSPY